LAHALRASKRFKQDAAHQDKNAFQHQSDPMQPVHDQHFPEQMAAGSFRI
jgi:hypothetical protein